MGFDKPTTQVFLLHSKKVRVDCGTVWQLTHCRRFEGNWACSQISFWYRQILLHDYRRANFAVCVIVLGHSFSLRLQEIKWLRLLEYHLCWDTSWPDGERYVVGLTQASTSNYQFGAPHSPSQLLPAESDVTRSPHLSSSFALFIQHVQCRASHTGAKSSKTSLMRPSNNWRLSKRRFAVFPNYCCLFCTWNSSFR